MVSYDELGARIIISFADGKVFLTESTIFGFIVAAIIAVIGIWLGSGLKRVPKGKQVFAEFVVEWIYSYTRDNLGKRNEYFAPYIGTVFSFILLGSSLGILGIRPITADVNVTAALAAMTFMLIQVSSIKRLGFKERLGELCDPYPFMLPLKLIEEFTLPVTLALRLFGNMIGGVIVIEMWMYLMELLSSFLTDVPFLRAVTVIPLNGFFDMFEPAIQTYIFTLLTMVFLQSAITGGDDTVVKKELVNKG